jgi:hypothetical protein
MTYRALRSFLTIGLCALVLVSCGDQGGDAGDAPVEPQPGATQAGSEGAAAGADEAPVGRISSGEVQLGPTLTPPVRPTTVGTRRAVSPAEAVGSVPFQILEPKDMPESANLDAVFLETPPEGEDVPGLPSVRLMYSFEPSGGIVVLQHEATGEPGTGEEIDIAGHGGWVVSDDPFVVEWEQDGLRIEVRGQPEVREALLAAARSMGPFSPDEE